MDNNFEAAMDEMLRQQAQACANNQEDGEAQGKAKEVLQDFLAYIKSFKFDLKCRKVAHEEGVNYKIVKNVFVANLLNKVAGILGLTINITGNIIKYAVEFVGNIIECIVNFASNVLYKIVNIITLGCGQID